MSDPERSPLLRLPVVIISLCLNDLACADVRVKDAVLRSCRALRGFMLVTFEEQLWEHCAAHASRMKADKFPVVPSFAYALLETERPERLISWLAARLTAGELMCKMRSRYENGNLVEFYVDVMWKNRVLGSFDMRSAGASITPRRFEPMKTKVAGSPTSAVPFKGDAYLDQLPDGSLSVRFTALVHTLALDRTFCVGIEGCHCVHCSSFPGTWHNFDMFVELVSDWPAIVYCMNAAWAEHRERNGLGTSVQQKFIPYDGAQRCTYGALREAEGLAEARAREAHRVDKRQVCRTCGAILLTCNGETTVHAERKETRALRARSIGRKGEIVSCWECGHAETATF